MSDEPLAVSSWTDEDLDAAIAAGLAEEDSSCLDILWREVERCEALVVANKQLAEKAMFRANNAKAEAERIKERVRFHLEARGLKDVACSYGKFARQANGGVQPLKIIGDYPDEFARIKREPDLDKVRLALKEGEILSFVEVLPKGEHLRMR